MFKKYQYCNNVMGPVPVFSVMKANQFGFSFLVFIVISIVFLVSCGCIVHAKEQLGQTMTHFVGIISSLKHDVAKRKRLFCGACLDTTVLVCTPSYISFLTM